MESAARQLTQELGNAESNIHQALRSLEKSCNAINERAKTEGNTEVPDPIKLVRRLSALEVSLRSLSNECNVLSQQRSNVVLQVLAAQLATAEKVDMLLEQTENADPYASKDELVDESWNAMTRSLRKQHGLMEAAQENQKNGSYCGVNLLLRREATTGTTFSFVATLPFVRPPSSLTMSREIAETVRGGLDVDSAVDIAKDTRSDFEILTRAIGDHQVPLVYLDSAATSQKPKQVLDAIVDYYKQHNANVHRGAHTLAREATAAYEETRTTVASFIHAPSRDEIVFTSGATEAINLVASSYGESNLDKGDEILLTEMEHHANLVPWQLLATKTGTSIKYGKMGANGTLDMEQMLSLLNEKTKIVAFQHVSNVLGSINPVKEIVTEIRKRSPKAVILLDACQSVPNREVNVQDLGVDFLAASGHKMCGPTGIGFLWGKSELLDKMPPYKGGGEMIDLVTLERTTFAKPPGRFEAGTPAIAEAVGLKAAIDYLQGIGMDNIEAYEGALVKYLHEQLEAIEGVHVLGPPVGVERAALCSFSVEGVHPSDLSTFLDLEGVAIRAGHHCCQPLHQAVGISHSTRASLYFYNTKDDIDYFIDNQAPRNLKHTGLSVTMASQYDLNDQYQGGLHEGTDRTHDTEDVLRISASVSGDSIGIFSTTSTHRAEHPTEVPDFPNFRLLIASLLLSTILALGSALDARNECIDQEMYEWLLSLVDENHAVENAQYQYDDDFFSQEGRSECVRMFRNVLCPVGVIVGVCGPLALFVIHRHLQYLKTTSESYVPSHIMALFHLSIPLTAIFITWTYGIFAIMLKPKVDPGLYNQNPFKSLAAVDQLGHIGPNANLYYTCVISQIIIMVLMYKVLVELIRRLRLECSDVDLSQTSFSDTMEVHDQIQTMLSYITASKLASMYKKRRKKWYQFMLNLRERSGYWVAAFFSSLVLLASSSYVFVQVLVNKASSLNGGQPIEYREGPAATVGNLYYASWFSSLLCFRLCLGCLEELYHVRKISSFTPKMENGDAAPPKLTFSTPQCSNVSGGEISIDLGLYRRMAKKERQSRLRMYFFLALFSIFCSVSAWDAASNQDAEWSQAQKYLIFGPAIVAAMSILLFIMCLRPTTYNYVSHLCFGGLLSLICFQIWLLDLIITMHSDDSWAVNSIGEMKLANLYYGSWASILLSALLMVSYVKPFFGGTSKDSMFVVWAGMVKVCMVILGASSHVWYNIKDSCQNEEIDAGEMTFCMRTRFAIGVGILGVVSGWGVMGSRLLGCGISPHRRNQAETIISVFLVLVFGTAVALVTSIGGPGQSVGDLFYATWLSFAVSLHIFVSCIDQLTTEELITEKATQDMSDRQSYVDFDALSAIAESEIQSPTST
eukprot:Nitzschia sp. Nitz4//scaffold8_size234185//87610//93238//NITZ4_001254-RA/size234185-processed-gene-0.154-mRNA-1//-1//CDS//3329559797//5621//frame0